MECFSCLVKQMKLLLQGNWVAEHLEILSRDPRELPVRDAMNVDDPCEFAPSFVPVKRFNPKGPRLVTIMS